MARIDQINWVQTRMRTMSVSDLSNLDGGLRMPGVRLMTAPESENDILWSAMEQLGWLKGETEDLTLPNGVIYQSRIYIFTEKGRAPIASLLSKLQQQPARTAELNATLYELYNTTCSEFLQTIRNRIAEAGGDRADVEDLLATTAVRWIKGGRNPDEAMGALESYFELTRRYLTAATRIKI